MKNNRLSGIAWLSAALTIWLASSLAMAQSEAPACPPQPTPPPQEKVEALFKAARDRGFLWTFEKDGRIGYLHGTIHMNKLEWSIPGPKTLAALRTSETVALELDVLDPQIQAQLADPSPAGIKEIVLPAALKQRMEVIAKRVCAPAAVVAAQHPVLQIATLTLFDARFAGMEMAYGSEIFLASFARAAKRTTVSLETPELQLRSLLGGDEKEIMAIVTSGVDLLESGRQHKQTDKLLTTWATGDLAGLRDYEKWCDCVTTEGERKFLARILDDRNPGLAKGIDALHREGKRVFAAVGALHMVGAKGLPGLLSEMGYKVERVIFDSGNATEEKKPEKK